MAQRRAVPLRYQQKRAGAKMYKRFNIIEAAFGGCTGVKTAIGSVICLVPEFGMDKNNIMYIPAWMI